MMINDKPDLLEFLNVIVNSCSRQQTSVTCFSTPLKCIYLSGILQKYKCRKKMTTEQQQCHPLFRAQNKPDEVGLLMAAVSGLWLSMHARFLETRET